MTGWTRSLASLRRGRRRTATLTPGCNCISARGHQCRAILPIRNHWEIYNLGQLLTAACVHYRVTGKTNFLAIARKAADCLGRRYSKTRRRNWRCKTICPSHYMGIVELYRATGEPRYLALAKRFWSMRALVKEGGSDNQDRIPFDQQTEAEGHAVRANYLYAGAADLFLETGDTNLWRPLLEIWTNVVTKKMYLTGGCGALYDGASPDGASNQAGITQACIKPMAGIFNCQTPPRITKPARTSAMPSGTGGCFWRPASAKFMEVVELELYNSVLSGVALDGTNFFYSNPLRVTDPLPVELRWSRTRVPFVSSFCCPPNLVRTIAESAGCAYGRSRDTIWVNLYGGSVLDTTLSNGRTSNWRRKQSIRGMAACGSKSWTAAGRSSR